MLTGCVLVNAEHLHGIPEGLPLLKVRPIYKFDTANPIRSRSSHEPVTAAILISIPRQLDNRQCDHEGIAHHQHPKGHRVARRLSLEEELYASVS